MAFDYLGTGRDDYIVYYGFGNQSEGKAGTKAPGFIAFAAKEGQSGSDNTCLLYTSNRHLRLTAKQLTDSETINFRQHNIQQHKVKGVC